MNEPPGGASALGIEAVEWLAEGGENLTVRVTGRWRRRRPPWSAQPTLVIEAPGRRYRFPAIAEPPSLSGIGPGMWRISFSVPTALVPELSGRVWLQFGAVIVPLPAAARPPELAPEESPPAPPEPAQLAPAEPSAGSAAPPGLSVTPNPPHSPEPEPEPESERGPEPEPGPAPAAPVGALSPGQAAPGPPPPREPSVTTLETALAEARAEVARLAGQLADQQRARQTAEQGARAERSIRADLTRQLRLRTEEAIRGRQGAAALTRAEEQVRSLERGVAQAREHTRQADAAIAAATTGREAAERKLAALVRERAPAAGEPPPAPQLRHLNLEQQLIARHPSADRIPAEPLLLAAAPVPSPPPPGGGTPAPGMVQTAQAMTDALRQELAGRALAQAGLRSQLIEAEARLAARQLIEQRTGVVIAQLREELDGLRAELQREREARHAADARAAQLQSDLGGARTRTQEARQAIAEIRGTLESLRQPPASPEPGGPPPVGPEPGGPPLVGPEAGGPPPAPAGGLEPDRLNQALLRLREQVPEPPGAPASLPAPGGPPSLSAPGDTPGLVEPAADLGPLTVGRPWLRSAFRSLARSDPDRAGRLVLDLVPAQRAVYPRPIAYDLELGGEWGCLRVTVRDGSQQIVSSDAPRSPADVDFRFAGEPADLGRLLRAGWLGRRFGRGRGRVSGRRSRLAALDALVGTQLGLGALHASGVRLAPRTALELLARLISPTWVDAERFTLAYEAPGQAPVFLLADAKRPLEVTENRPAGPVTTTIAGPAGTLELVLRDDPAAAGALAGDPRPVRLLRDWVMRAQSA
jgi:hypothetical protein